MPELLEFSSPAALDQARSLISEGLFQDALKLLGDLPLEQQGTAAVLHLTGCARLASGDAQSAVSALADAVDLDPGNATLCLDLARAVVELGWVEQARAVIEQAIHLDPSSHEAFLLLAKVAEATDAPQDAIVALRRAVELLQAPSVDLDSFTGEAVPLPLPLGTRFTFTGFKSSGSIGDYRITASSPDERFLLSIRVSGAESQDSQAVEPLESGTIQVDRLLKSVPDSVAAQLALFDLQSVPYSIFPSPGK